MPIEPSTAHCVIKDNVILDRGNKANCLSMVKKLRKQYPQAKINVGLGGGKVGTEFHTYIHKGNS